MRFGTDGVRGVANQELTPEFSLLVGRAAGNVLGGGRFLVGRDTRRSGPMIEAALSAGLSSAGVDVHLVGVVPTPAVATLAALDGVPAAMISASHNPFADNGIKLFASGGIKLTDAVQQQIEAEIDRLSHGDASLRPTGADVGAIEHVEGRATQRYEDCLIEALGGRRLDRLRIILDCGHGAACYLAGELFERCGANVEVINAAPDGVNINEASGSTDTSALSARVVASGADAGFAFDGDADRVIAVDERGDEVDGDHLIALCALDLKARGQLRDDTVVVTVMSNLGFRRAMESAGVHVVETKVGDRYLLEALDAGHLSLGGEQSGHIIFRDLATTGDGMLSALVVSDLLVREGKRFSETAAAAMTRMPQVLLSVRTANRPTHLDDRLQADVRAARDELGVNGRVLIRPSGTEPLVRVMVEADTASTAQSIAERLAGAVERAAAG